MENDGKTPWYGGSLNNQPHKHLYVEGIDWVYHLFNGLQHWRLNSYLDVTGSAGKRLGSVRYKPNISYPHIPFINRFTI